MENRLVKCNESDKCEREECPHKVNHQVLPVDTNPDWTCLEEDWCTAINGFCRCIINVV